VYATDRDEVKPIWRKLNALAGYTAPEYTKDNIALVAPWMRITIGDLFNQQAVLVNSVNYTLHSADTTWETNIEQDPQMMQTPHKVDVNLTLTPITDWLPQKGGKFYSLAKRFDGESGLPLPGNDNWLSDTKNNAELSPDQLAELAGNQENNKETTQKKTIALQLVNHTKFSGERIELINKKLTMGRYTTTNIMKDLSGKRRRSTTIFPTIPATANDTFIITTSADRLDKLASAFYDDVSLWWVIAAANGLGKGTLIVPANTNLRIPAKTQFLDQVIQTNRTR
jgi:hypothetical protein